MRAPRCAIGAANSAIDIVVESALWEQAPESQATIRRAIAAAASEMADDCEVSVVLADDAKIRALNLRWRGRDEPTDVLSFPTKVASFPRAAPRLLGDVVIAYESVAREAGAEHKPFLDHLAHLTIHGFLHLLGYDHDSDDDAQAMEQRERAILARLDVSDPYEARDAGALS